MTKRIRLVAIDLDGTLLNSRFEVSDTNRAALAQAARQGVEIVIVTGRRFHTARLRVEPIPCPVTLIASNGAWSGSTSGEVFHRDFLPAPVARDVLEAAPAYRPYAVVIFDRPDRGQIVMENNAAPDGPLGWYLKNSPQCLLQVGNLVAAVAEDPVQVMFGGAPIRIEPVEALLRDSRAGPSVHLTWTKYFTRDISILDVMTRGCSKGAALERWIERRGIHPSEIIAIGDNYNDLEMLQLAGRAVVMGNSSSGLAREGWFVTRTNDEDGVAAALRQFVLNDPP